jgi:hypothetical protein
MIMAGRAGYARALERGQRAAAAKRSFSSGGMPGETRRPWPANAVASAGLFYASKMRAVSHGRIFFFFLAGVIPTPSDCLGI